MPLPSPFLYPSPSLLPGQEVLPQNPGEFSTRIVESIAPWSDPQGFWVTYNQFLGMMFEIIYDIVVDTGDANMTLVGELASPLSTSTAITFLSVSPLAESVTGGATIQVSSAANSQFFTCDGGANVGSTAIPVLSEVPIFDYPVGSGVNLAYVPGWSTLLDPENCPTQFLPFLAQFVGATVPVGTADTLARSLIRNETGGLCACGRMDRGTVPAIRAAAQLYLSGSRSVVIIERTAANGNLDAYHFILIVRPEEVVNLNSLIDAVNNTKPGGVQWTLVQTDGWTISQMEDSAVTLSALESNFATLTGLERDAPGT